MDLSAAGYSSLDGSSNPRLGKALQWCKAFPSFHRIRITMNTITVSEACPPNHWAGEYWERSKDPFHPEAFAGIPAENVMVFVGGSMSTGQRKEGWLAIDYAENPIGFVPDGTVCDGSPIEHIRKMGPYGHICVYPLDAQERIAYHEGKGWPKA
jgi:hypothetical protein